MSRRKPECLSGKSSNKKGVWFGHIPFLCFIKENRACAPDKKSYFCYMTPDAEDFVRALHDYVLERLAASGETADYCTEALRVVDARNHLFVPAGRRATDEADDVYALRDLCRPDEDTMELRPDGGRLAAVARNFF